ncbi:mitochondrial metal transporter [Purpureocillium takamizusanense]|uniref:Mitochondrial metal transporter n=1 Tax=Purpureocillium takamizusanense TaxID=2060973 RepID=A0A9Q8VE17_9HYPO|nr:mitochondrial metal transporter [Purpureocillium takamizusanense]UNI21439.1 mitochondrial metal transporter [Purpureocillium takamizusanense]
MPPQARRSTGLALWCVSVSGATPAAAAAATARTRRGRGGGGSRLAATAAPALATTTTAATTVVAPSLVAATPASAAGRSRVGAAKGGGGGVVAAPAPAPGPAPPAGAAATTAGRRRSAPGAGGSDGSAQVPCVDLPSMRTPYQQRRQLLLLQQHRHRHHHEALSSSRRCANSLPLLTAVAPTTAISIARRGPQARQQTLGFSSSASRPQARPLSSVPSSAAPSTSTSTSTSSCGCGHSSHLHLFHHHNLDASVAVAPSVLLHLAPVRGRIRSLPGIMGAAQQQTRDHGDHGHGHSHGHGHHHHHHDNSYLISANKNDSGVRITRIGLLSNLGMAVAKFVGGWAFNSKSMTADAWHSIADLASDVLTLATVSWSLKPPSDRFPLGFGKVESLGSLGVSGMLLIGGFYMGWESAISLYGHYNPEAAHEILEHMGGHGHGHSHSHSAASLGIPSIHAAWLAAGTILIKEWLYHATMKVARERKSSVLASNAVHHRVDSLTGIVTLAAILGANVFQNAAWLDPVGGLLISIMVVNAGFENTKSALYELADQSIDDEVKGSVRKQAQRALANVSEGHEAELRDVSGIKSGQNYLVDLEMAVPGKWTVEDVKELEDGVRTLVGGKVRGVRRVRVRFVSRDGPVNERFDEFIPGSVHVEADPEPRENGETEDMSAGDDRHKH